MPTLTLLQLIEQQAQRLTRAGVAFGHGTLTAFNEAVGFFSL